MKKILITATIWLVVILCWWGLFFYCDGKGDGYVGMGVITAMVILFGGTFLSVFTWVSK